MNTAQENPKFPLPPEHRQCKAKSKHTGERCKKYAIDGGTVCKFHGGRSPAAQAKAAERVRTREIQAEAAAVLAHEGLEPVEDPLGELSRLAQSAVKLSDALGARVNALGDLEHFGDKYAPTLKAEVQMYERALDRAHRLLDSLVKHGYAERQIRLQEGQAVLISGVIRRVLQGIGLQPEQVQEAQRLLAGEFRALTEAESLL